MDWSSDVCSSDLTTVAIRDAESDGRLVPPPRGKNNRRVGYTLGQLNDMRGTFGTRPWRQASDPCAIIAFQNFKGGVGKSTTAVRSEEHTSELQSLMRTSYAVLCLKKKKKIKIITNTKTHKHT